MNWYITPNSDSEIQVERADDEDPERQPDAGMVEAVQNAATTFSEVLGGADNFLITAMAHESTGEEGFQAGYLQLTVSRVDPDA